MKNKSTRIVFYWICRLISALTADAQFKPCKIHIERDQIKTMAEAHRILNQADRLISELLEVSSRILQSVIDSANEALAEIKHLRRNKLPMSSRRFCMRPKQQDEKNAYARSDA